MRLEPKGLSPNISRNQFFDRLEKGLEPRAGFGPATNSLRGCRSDRAELPRLEALDRVLSRLFKKFGS